MELCQGGIPVVWDPSGKVRIYYPHPGTERWIKSREEPGPHDFVAQTALTFLHDMWLSHVHLGSVPKTSYDKIDSKLSEAVPASALVKVKKYSWVMDTGSGHDLVPQHIVSEPSLTVVPPSSSISLQTASGPLAAESIAQVRVAALGTTSEALVLPSTPMVLSIGRRCMEDGYSFVWEANQNPYMKIPEGRIITLFVDGNIPYLTDDASDNVVLLAVAGDGEVLPPPDPEEDGHRRDVKKLANSLPHLLTHFPKNPWCDACRRAKFIRTACPMRDAELPPDALLVIISPLTI